MDRLKGYPCYSTVVFIIVVQINSMAVIASVNGDMFSGPKYQKYSEDICGGSVFQPSCGQSEVIVVQNATYGRMKMGKCVALDMGFLGCHKNVLPIAHKYCSGHSSCDITVPNDDLEDTRPCLELQSYLQITYTCVKVITAMDYPCTPPNILKVLPQEGFISSEKPASKCGSGNTVWMIEAKAGQKVNITLIDYRLDPQHNVNKPSGTNTVCRSFVRDVASQEEVTLCNIKDSVQHVMLSAGNTLEIEIGNQYEKPESQYLLHYAVVGCADPSLSSAMWFKRMSDDAITLGCKGSSDEYTLTCKERVWMGTYYNCSAAQAKGTETTIQNGAVDLNSLPRGLVITAVLAIALVVGTSIVVVGILMFKRNRPREGETPSYSAHNSLQDNPYKCSTTTTRPSYTCPKDNYGSTPPNYWSDTQGHCGNAFVEELVQQHPPYQHQMMPQRKQVDPRLEACYQYTENPCVNNNFSNERGRHDYTHIWERPLPAPESQHSC